MQLADPWDAILTRKAEEAPGGIAPLLPELEPNAPPASQQIVITAKKIPPVAPFQPLTDVWDKIVLNRAKQPASVQTYGWERYVPWAMIGLLGAAAFVALGKKGARRGR